MQIRKHTVATLEYSLSTEAGQVIDSSENHGPMQYLHGMGHILPGLETALEGKSVGEELKLTLQPEQAYGHKDPARVIPVARKDFMGAADIKVGMRFQAQGDGVNRIVTVVGVSDDTITVDANHPLAGVIVNIAAKVLDVREAKQEEIDHGHVCMGDHSCDHRPKRSLEG